LSVHKEHLGRKNVAMKAIVLDKLDAPVVITALLESSSFTHHESASRSGKSKSAL